MPRCVCEILAIRFHSWLLAIVRSLHFLIGLWAVWAWPLKASGDASPARPLVEMTFEIHSLRVEREDPQVFRANAVFVFTWKSADLPGFEIEKLNFLNRASDLDQRAVLLTPKNPNGMRGVLIAVRGLFDATNNFSAYPFNRVRLPIIFELPKHQGIPVNIIDAEVAHRHSPPAVTESDSYSIKQIDLQTGPYFEVWSMDKNLLGFSDVEALGVFVDANHRPSRSLIMVFIPLGLIFAVIYSSLWWKEESASSRAVMASLFAATALAFSSINLQPNVSYPTGNTLAFTLLYLNLAIIGLCSVLAFRAAKRGEAEKFRRLRLAGRWAGLLLAVIGGASLAIWIVIQRNQPLHDWFEDSRRPPVLNANPKATSPSQK